MLEGIIKNGRIASAYLFVGPPGSAKLEAARAFADRLGCPDIDRIIIGPDGASVKIDQILELQRFTRYGPSAGAHLLAIVEKADEMTPEAAAAFLKTLEEPAERVTFILLVEREDRLPETIISRCQKILFEEEAGGWQPDPELSAWYAELRSLGGKSILERFEFSSRLEKERERIEELLYDLIFYARHELGDLKLVRTLLEAVKNIKKKTNLKMVLDVACLRAGET